MIDNKELANKLKPELKKFDLNNEQIESIVIAIKRNPQHLENCINYLKNADPNTSGDNVVTEIIDICY